MPRTANEYIPVPEWPTMVYPCPQCGEGTVVWRAGMPYAVRYPDNGACDECRERDACEPPHGGRTKKADPFRDGFNDRMACIDTPPPGTTAAWHYRRGWKQADKVLADPTHRTTDD